MTATVGAPANALALQVLQVFIPGRPVTKGSLKNIAARGRKAHLVEDHPESKPWRATVRRVIEAMRVGPAQPVASAVAVELHFYVEQIHGANGLIWPSHDTEYPTAITIGDIDKFERNILDALKDARVIADDCLVVDLTSRKRWAELTPDGTPRAGVQITVWRMP